MNFTTHKEWEQIKSDLQSILPVEFENGLYNGNGQFKLIVPHSIESHEFIRIKNIAYISRIRRVVETHLNQSVLISIEKGEQSEPELELEQEQEPAIYDNTDYRNTIRNIELSSMVTNYFVEDGNMIMAKNYQGDIKKTLIAPFSATISKDITVNLDEETLRYYHINGQRLLNGKLKRFNLIIEAEDYNKPNRLATAIIKRLPGPPPATDSEHQKRWSAGIAYLTNEQKTMQSLHAIPRTGWDEKAENFVMPGGGYGKGLCYLAPELKADLNQFKLKKLTEEKFKFAMWGLLSLADVFDPGEFFVILAHAFLPPLLHWIGNDGRYLLHLYADTGHLKTEISKLMIRLYGPDDNNAITYKWSDTPLGISSRADALKNCLLLLNDLKPNMISKDHLDQWVAFVQSAVDGEGKKRATAGGGAGRTYNCNAIVLSNGEAVPDAGEASYIARMILLPMSRSFAGTRNQLFDNIKNNYAPLFSGIMYNYVAWLNETKGNEVQKKLSYIQSKSEIETSHPRLAANHAANSVAMTIFIEFLLAKQIIAPLDAIIMAHVHKLALNKATEFTNNKIHNSKYSTLFLTALLDAVASGYAVFSNKITSGTNRVGWEDSKHYHIISAAKDVVDTWLIRTNKSPINNSLEDIKRQIYQDGLSRVPAGRLKSGWHDCQLVDKATNQRTLVISVIKARLNK